METIEASYRVTTPMFLGGTDPEKQAELRLPSFKGALRFWWRASVWPQIAASGGSARELHRREAELFGSANEQVGQSKISMRLLMDSGPPRVIPKDTQLKDGNTVVGQGARYLGYGVMEAFASKKKETQEGKLTRSCLSAPFSFRVSVLPRKRLTDAQREEVLRALKLLGLLGSLGSKARKGYGSLTLTRLVVGQGETWRAPSTAEQLQEQLTRLLKEILSAAPGNHTDPPFTAFSSQTRILLVASPESSNAPPHAPLALLDLLGREMIRYRSWGHSGKILGNIDSEKRFRKDHDLMKLPVNKRKCHPERIAFGLPHNYGKKDEEQVKPEQFDRRASPLMLHIHQAADDAPTIAILCFMPAAFLPQDRTDISVGGNTVPLNSANLWQPIHEFLARFTQNQTKERFGQILVVRRA
jgi:CRISPR-associated protein Cmr1